MRQSYTLSELHGKNAFYPAAKNAQTLSQTLYPLNYPNVGIYLGGGFKYVLFSPPPGEDSNFD